MKIITIIMATVGMLAFDVAINTVTLFSFSLTF